MILLTKLWRQLLSSTLLISLIISLILSLAITFIFSHYLNSVELKIVETGVYTKKNFSVFADLNGDSSTEKIFVYQWNENYISIPFYQSDGATIISQSNIAGKLLRQEKRAVLIGDYNQDENKEAYFFYRRHDSLFLTGIELFGKGEFLKGKFISLLRKGKSGYDSEICPSSCLYDINQDGSADLVFAVSSGFSIFPRQIFIYDVKNDQLKSSAFYGNRILDFHMAKQADGSANLLLNASACGNMHDSTYPYHDGDAYLIVLDQHLKPAFDPIKFLGETNVVYPFPYTYQGEDCYLVFNYRSNALKEKGYQVLVYSLKGALLFNKTWPYLDSQDLKSVKYLSWKGKEDAYILDGRQQLCRFTPEMDLEVIYQFPFQITDLQSVDINGNGKKEILAFSRDYSRLFVLDSYSMKSASLDTHMDVGSRASYLIREKNKRPKWFLQLGTQFTELVYRESTHYYMYVFGVFGGLFIFLFLVFRLIQYMATLQMRRKKQMAELQLANWKNQLNPHFTFNTLNSVGAVILKEDKQEAYRFFVKFTRLVGHVIDSSSSISISLDKEFEFMELYLELEKFRFEDKFNYEIDIDPNLDNAIPVPKMFLQTYVENAIRHGLMDREANGLIKIQAKWSEEYHIFIVEDNGIGRFAARQKSRFGHHMGMDLMESYFNQLNALNSKKIILEIRDLYPEDKEFPGTRIQINIPKNYSYEL